VKSYCNVSAIISQAPKLEDLMPELSNLADCSLVTLEFEPLHTKK
jgi:hypothetical protein